MTDYIGDRMGLPGAGRSLYHHPLHAGVLKPLDDGDLFLIKGLGEKELTGAGLLRSRPNIANRGCCGRRVGSAEHSPDAGNGWDVGRFVRGFGHESYGWARQQLHGFDRLFQPLEIGDEKIIRARTRVKRPSIRNDEIWTRVGNFAVVLAGIIGMIAACPVELGAGIAKDRGEGFPFEWRKLALRREFREVLAGEARDEVGAGIVRRGKGLQCQYRVDAARADLNRARLVEFKLDQLLDDGVV